MLRPYKKPNILIINCFNDNNVVRRGCRHSVPQQMTTIALAGTLDRGQLNISTHCEFHSGTYTSYQQFAVIDMLVLTGLNTSFDRMKQLTAYAKTMNPSIVVVMGGPVARTLPQHASKFFDEVSEGDVEALVDIVNDVFCGDFAASEDAPRYDLAPWSKLIGYAETSRNCNFRCHFCSMSAENRKHVTYESSVIEQQVECMGKRQAVMFLDQNFFAGPRAHFRERMEILLRLHREGKLKAWSALVTSDFFKDPSHVKLAKESGCIGFFSGVESFSKEQIAAYKKKQNLILPQEEIIMSALNAGVMFHYGLIIDPTLRKLDDIKAELEFVQNNDRITLPSFLSLTIPLLGTPLFEQRLQEDLFLPNVRLRDMDGRTLICKPQDNLEEVVKMIRSIDCGYMDRKALMRRQWRFYKRYRDKLSFWGMASALYSTRVMGFPRLSTQGREDRWFNRTHRTHVPATEALGNLYRPEISMSSRFENYFEALQITDDNGQLNESLEHDLGDSAEEYSILVEAV